MKLASIRRHMISLLVLMWLIPLHEVAFSGADPGIQGIQTLYDQKDYQKVLEELAKLDSNTVGAPDIRRLKIRTLLRLGKPKDALSDYDDLVQLLKRDDQSILQEVALAFVVVLTQDMREQMRGVAYTALKEWQSPDAISFLQDGLNDGSGLVRALAAEGLAKLDRGRRSERFRRALDDQAALVKEAVLKGLGKSGDDSVIGLVEPLLQEPEVRVRVAAAEALCRFGRKQGCALLAQSGKAPNPDERGAAIRALVDLQGAQVFPVLIEA
ncbi:MAG: HEAT repeat domain-containing protein, partial [Nitrospira sp.]